MTAVDKIIVKEPFGTQQECTACDAKAWVAVDIFPAKPGPIKFFYLCQSHALELIASIEPLVENR